MGRPAFTDTDRHLRPCRTDAGSKGRVSGPFQTYKDDPLFTHVTPVPLRHGLAFRAEEVIRPGQGPEDMHRWFLFVYLQDRVYTVGLSGPLKAFQQGILPPIYTGVMRSFEPLPR